MLPPRVNWITTAINAAQPNPEARTGISAISNRATVKAVRATTQQAQSMAARRSHQVGPAYAWRGCPAFECFVAGGALALPLRYLTPEPRPSEPSSRVPEATPCGLVNG